MAAILQKLDSSFPYVIVVPSFFDSMNIWITARDLGGLMGLEIKHNLLFPTSQIFKRGIDLTPNCDRWASALAIFIIDCLADQAGFAGGNFLRSRTDGN
jgi:hypothetical protein